MPSNDNIYPLNPPFISLLPCSILGIRGAFFTCKTGSKSFGVHVAVLLFLTAKLVMPHAPQCQICRTNPCTVPPTYKSNRCSAELSGNCFKIKAVNNTDGFTTSSHLARGVTATEFQEIDSKSIGEVDSHQRKLKNQH